ncbi:MAG: hypothetical protein E7388_01205 [Ruminococcaceae bacterium]|nr:hypothetical protein [Oscillospiraceae bacterium]
MKKLINSSYGYITIESAIVIPVIIFITGYLILLLLNELVALNDYSVEISKRCNELIKNDSGNLLRLVKVITETGGRIIDEVFEKYNK